MPVQKSRIKDFSKKLQYQNLEPRQMLAGVHGVWADLGSYLERDANFEIGQVSNLDEFSPYVRNAIESGSDLGFYTESELEQTTSWTVGQTDNSLFSSRFPTVEGLNSISAENLGRFMVWEFDVAEEGIALSSLETLHAQGLVEFYFPNTSSPVDAVPSDTLYPLQWHLDGNANSVDIQAEPAWDSYSGLGTIIGIVDDGLDYNHEDINPNFHLSSSYDFFGNDSLPFPNFSLDDAHGTAAGGVAAAAQNGIGVSGVAHRAQLSGLRAGEGNTIFGADSAAALGHQNQTIDIYNNSYGPGGSSIVSPYAPRMAAIENAAINGRGGLGNIIVWSAGNGRTNPQLTTYRPASSSRYTIAVAAVDSGGDIAWYSTPGTSNLVSAPSSGVRGVVTTDLTGSAGYDSGGGSWGDSSGNYTDTFGGTSSAAPTVAGVTALMLEANPSLSWLDVQAILVESSTKIDPVDSSWIVNGGGNDYSVDYGFGMVNARAASSLAASWTNLGTEWSNSLTNSSSVSIPDFNGSGLFASSSISVPGTAIENVTSVEVVVDISHTYRGDLEIRLVSPSGTVSKLTQQNSDSGADYDNYLFTTVANWGEVSKGEWTLEVEDKSSSDVGVLNSWTINVYGTEDLDDQISEARFIGEGVDYVDEISNSGDVDMFRTVLYAGQEINVAAQTAGNGLDPEITLFNDLGQYVIHDDDGGPNTDSLLSWTAPADGTYYLAVHGYQNNGGTEFDPFSGAGDDTSLTSNRGEYYLEFVDPDNGYDEAIPIDIGSGVEGVLASGLDVDLYQFVVDEPGQTISFDIELPDASQGDTVLSLYEFGDRLLQNDDFGSLASSLTYTFETPGPYWIGVSHYPFFNFEPEEPEDHSMDYGSMDGRAEPYFLSIDSGDIVEIGELGSGVAVHDNAIGAGYIMYSRANVHSRFVVHPNNAEHFVATRLVGAQWQYSTNLDWENFTPQVNDFLVAEVDFNSSFFPDMFAGDMEVVGGVAAGYLAGNLQVYNDEWDGQINEGEFGIYGGETLVRNLVTTFPGGTEYSAGNVGSGVAVTDAATGTGYMLFSEESVHSRFGGLNPSNADHFVAVRQSGSVWQYNTNSDTSSAAWVSFTPRPSDTLVAEISFSADLIASLIGLDTSIGGISAGYIVGDLAFVADQWAGNSNNGEFQVFGTSFTVDSSSIPTGNLGSGVPVTDAVTGAGFMMYSEQSVHSRFGGLNPASADHFIAVRLRGNNWQYNTNSDTPSAAWVNFSPVGSDRLVANINYAADTIASLEGTSSVFAGINSGYVSGDLIFVADRWNGAFNDGEFQVLGASFTVPQTLRGNSSLFSVGNSGNGVAATDAATGTGYMMYSSESVHARWGGLNSLNADHFVAVRLASGNWQYNTNSDTPSAAWVSFTPEETDRLVATINYTADTIISMEGALSQIAGIDAGYSSGDLMFLSNRWGGSFNNGEFEVQGTLFTVESAGGGEIYSAGNVGGGVAATDAATGSGFMMYSVERVHDRFGSLNSLNADHFIAVRFNEGDIFNGDSPTWEYNNNSDTPGAEWIAFTPQSTDRLMASIDFAADTIVSLQANSSVIQGIAAGYSGGDLVFVANRFNGAGNSGEFEVSGTYFSAADFAGGFTFSVGDVGSGVPATDTAIGLGYMMFSAERVQTRFGGLHPNHADFFVAVRLNGSTWQYNTNSDNPGLAWVNFTPQTSDHLVAEIDFSADTISSLVGTSSSVGGIASGYSVGDLAFAANRFGGVANNGEFEVSGSLFTVGNIGDTKFGIAVDDTATGDGYILYSNASVHSRFGGLNSLNADHFIAVRRVGFQWQYNDNFGWVDFEAEASDVLVAEVDFSNDTADSLFGLDAMIGGIEAGFVGGELEILADFWGGTSNDGEFGIAGSFFIHEEV